MKHFSCFITNKRELQQIALNHLSDIDFKEVMKIYKKCTAEPYYFLVNDATLASDNPLRFRKKLPKYQLCHQRNLRSMNILLVKKYYHLIKSA